MAFNVLTKKAFGFIEPQSGDNPPNGAQITVRTSPNIVTSVPDWVRNDPMFQWGVDDGDILVLESKPTVQVAAEAPVKK